MTAHTHDADLTPARPDALLPRLVQSLIRSPYLLLLLALTLLGLVLPFFDARGIIAALFIFAVVATLRLLLTIRDTLRAQLAATEAQTRTVAANNDLLKLVVTGRRGAGDAE